MSETPPEAPADNPAEALTDEDGIPVDNPKGTGYAVYDTQLMRYVGGVTEDKPKASDAKALAPNGHRVVKV